MKWFAIWLLVSVSAFTANSSAPATSEFERGNQQYAAGQFPEAIATYEALVRQHQWSTSLFYNLGNAQFRAGDPARAILNYERTLALDPNHAEAQANLRVAREQSRGLELTRSWAERYLGFLAERQFAWTAAAGFWLALFAAVSVRFARTRPRGAMTVLVLGALIFCVAAGAVYALELTGKMRQLAIVTAKNTEARLATADNANSVLALPPGTEIKILSTRGNWIYAALPNALRGWLPAKNVEPVRL